MICFLKNTKRWQKVKTLLSDTFFNITVKVADCIADINYLVLRVFDLVYLPKSISVAVVPTPTTIPPSIQSNRWKGRTDLSTPSKRPYISDSVNDPIKLSNKDTTISETIQIKYNLFRIEDLIDSITLPAFPSTVIHLKDSLFTPARPLTSDNRFRLHCNRYLPKKYIDLK